MAQQLPQPPSAQEAAWRPPDHPAWYERLMRAAEARDAAQKEENLALSVTGASGGGGLGGLISMGLNVAQNKGWIPSIKQIPKLPPSATGGIPGMPGTTPPWDPNVPIFDNGGVSRRRGLAQVGENEVMVPESRLTPEMIAALPPDIRNQLPPRPQLVEKVPPGYALQPPPMDLGGVPQLPPPPRGINQPPPTAQRPMPRSQEYEQILGARPELPTPRLWQRIAGVGVGALGGYVNAAGRTRIDPEAIQRAQTNIQYPGYGAKMEAWRSDVELAKEQAAIEQQRADREMRREEMESEAEARAALADANRARAESMRAPKEPKETTYDKTRAELQAEYDVAIKVGLTPEEARKAVFNSPDAQLTFRSSTNEVTGDVTVIALDPRTGRQVGEPIVVKGAGRKRPPAAPQETILQKRQQALEQKVNAAITQAGGDVDAAIKAEQKNPQSDTAVLTALYQLKVLQDRATEDNILDRPFFGGGGKQAAPATDPLGIR